MALATLRYISRRRRCGGGFIGKKQRPPVKHRRKSRL